MCTRIVEMKPFTALIKIFRRGVNMVEHDDFDVEQIEEKPEWCQFSIFLWCKKIV
jgi:hypothetical protein